MTEYMTEQEQIEQLKNWIKQYGPTVLLGILLSLVVVAGWHLWERRQLKILTHASGVYDEMLTLRAQNESAAADVQANKLISHYPKTPYAQMAAFMLARNAVLDKNYAEAVKELTWVVDHSSSHAIRSIAKIRIARIHIANNKAADALNVLKKIDDKVFRSLANEVSGDAYLALNDSNKAKETYQLALQELPKGEVTRKPLLQMKLDNVIVNSETKS